MKKNFRTLVALSIGLLFALTSCNKENGPETLDVSTPEIAEKSASTITFDVNSNTSWTIEIPGNEDWLSVSPMNGKNNGTVTVSLQASTDGTSKGIRSADVVVKTKSLESTVEVKQLGAITDFFGACGLIRLTATWCGPCTGLGATIAALEKKYGDQLVCLTPHASGDPMFHQESNNFGRLFGSGGSVPFTIIQLKNTVLGAVAQSNFEKHIDKALSVAPTTGIQVSSEIVGDEVKVSVQVLANKDGNYGIGLALMEDNIVAAQSGVSNYTHNNVLRAYATKSMGDPIGELKAWEESEPMEFTIPIKSSWKKENLRLFVYTVNVKEAGQGKNDMNNVTYAPVDGKVEYRFKED